MTAPAGFETGQSVQALDQNQHLLARNGYGVISGGAVSISSGTLGPGEATVKVAGATLLVDGSAVSVSSATVALEQSTTRPRKDLVVYDPARSSGGRLTAITGTPARADPSGSTRQQAEQPAPPALGGAVDALSDTGESKIPLAEIWVPPNVNAITTDDVLNRRQPVAPRVGSIDAAERIGIPIYSADSNAPPDTLYFNSSNTQTKYKDSSGTVHSQTGTDTHTNVSDDGTSALTDTDDINFGTDLSVTDDGDGTVTVDATASGGGSPTTLFMSDYAPSGGVVDSAFDTAISDATSGDTIVFDHNSYELQTSHTVTKPLTIDATPDATLTCSNASNNNAHILFEGGGIQSTTTTSAATTKGQRTLPVNNASSFAVDDRILVIAQSYEEPVNAHIHFDVVESVDTSNNRIDIKGGLDRGFASGEGEPIALYRVQDAYIESPRVFDCRRGIDVSRGTRGLTIVDPVIRPVKPGHPLLPGRKTAPSAHLLTVQRRRRCVGEIRTPSRGSRTTAGPSPRLLTSRRRGRRRSDT